MKNMFKLALLLLPAAGYAMDAEMQITEVAKQCDTIEFKFVMQRRGDEYNVARWNDAVQCVSDLVSKCQQTPDDRETKAALFDDIWATLKSLRMLCDNEPSLVGTINIGMSAQQQQENQKMDDVACDCDETTEAQQ